MALEGEASTVADAADGPQHDSTPASRKEEKPDTPEKPVQLPPIVSDCDGSESSTDGELSPSFTEQLKKLFSKPITKPEKRPAVLTSFDLNGIAEYISSGRCRNIVCMCGAGISVSAGIPDFRTPGTGLYSQLARYQLPKPEAVFSIDYFRRNPHPFHMLAKELFPGNYTPTPTHCFMKLLHDKGLLLRCYTQNIDSLEHQAGLPKEAVVAAHGNFDAARCIHCKKEYSTDYVRQAVFADEICRCERCEGLVKPEIVFFGEALPQRFWSAQDSDFELCDLLIVMGTSLVVGPFNTLVDQPKKDVPRLLVNREVVGAWPHAHFGEGFVFHEELCYRDAQFLGDCDEGVRQLAELLGWREELEALVAEVSAAAAGGRQVQQGGAGGEAGHGAAAAAEAAAGIAEVAVAAGAEGAAAAGAAAGEAAGEAGTAAAEAAGADAQQLTTLQDGGVVGAEAKSAL